MTTDKCPKGGEHDWNLIFHSSGITLPVVGTCIECTKCGKKEEKVVKLTPEEHKKHIENMMRDTK